MRPASDPRRGESRRVALADRVFRASERFRLIDRGRLTDATRGRLGIDAADETFGGVLLPVTDGAPPKAVCRQSVALLRALRRPARLPVALRRSLRADSRTLARLVLDSVLELRDGPDYVSGASALPALGLPRPAFTSDSRLGRLAIDALRFAQEARIAAPATLAEWLYFYNRAPVSPAWAERLADPIDVARFLGLGRAFPCGRQLRSDWNSAPAADTGWLGWFSKAHYSERARYKVYVSIDTSDLETGFPTVVRVASAERVPAFKVASDVYGLQRPDKLVLYVRTRRDVERLGRRLGAALTGARAQGAPFSCALDADGLLSWGRDPSAPSPERGASWRRAVTLRLAIAIASARAHPARDPGVEPWQFALARVALEGIDTDLWRPEPDSDGARH